MPPTPVPIATGIELGRTPRPDRRVLTQVLIGTAILALLGAAGGFGYHYWTVARFFESTNDAYVKADSTTVAPKISGHIAEVLVADNQPVHVGEILARIDDRDFRTALNAARADVETARAAIHTVEAQTVLQRTAIEQQAAAIAVSEASLTFARAEAGRYEALARTGAGTIQRSQQTDSMLAVATAQLRRDRAAKLAAEQTIQVLTTERNKARAQRDRAEAAATQAELNLSYAEISAPVDGIVGARTLRIGQYVTPGTQLMAVVPLGQIYIVANFKETQLSRVRTGQPVSIEIDAMPGATLKGHVESLAPASGLEFALLPPDNATGNFTKIVQRIPVRIVLDGDKPDGLLRAGMSVEPTIDTRDDAVRSLPANPTSHGKAQPLISLNDTGPKN